MIDMSIHGEAWERWSLNQTERDDDNDNHPYSTQLLNFHAGVLSTPHLDQRCGTTKVHRRWNSLHSILSIALQNHCRNIY